jgi:CubicO group peptidase (beta-lactamase class C family)
MNETQGSNFPAKSPTIAPSSTRMTRRDVLSTGGAIAFQVISGSGVHAAAKPDPFHDPSFSILRPRGELVGGLHPSARQAQEAPRLIRGIQVTGLPDVVPELDEKIVEIMAGSGIPGVSLALAESNELLCTRGYGRASLVGDVVVEPTMPATIMSVIKPITVTAALTLVRDKKLRLNDLAFNLLRQSPLLAAGQSADPRQYNIEVRQLMSHTAGLFNVVETLNDPARFKTLAQRGDIALVHGRICQNDLVRIGMREKLLFDPGQKYAYSGQGIQVLGRIVEKVSGLRLDRYIQQAIFDPLGIRSYYVGSYLNENQYRQFMRASREHVYTMSPSLYDKDKKVHRPQDVSKLGYASWGQADACGWGALSSLDLLRFVSAVPTLLGPEVWQALTQRPMINNDAGQRVPAPMGLGWGVVEAGGNKGINHGGGWPGQRSFAGLRPDGGSLAVLVNSDDDAHVNMIVGAARQFFSRPGSVRLKSPSWQDYGFPT